MKTYKKKGILFEHCYTITADEEFLENIKNNISFIVWDNINTGDIIQDNKGNKRRVQEISHSGKYVIFWDK